MTSKQTKPNAQDNDDGDGGDMSPELPAREDFFGIAFQTSLGANIGAEEMSHPDRMPHRDNGLPDSPESMTQSRPAHGRESLGTHRYVAAKQEGVFT